jgi:purine nucleoside permease
VINAALSIAALVASPDFDLSKTYFLIAGIGGINPKVGTLGSVILAHYVVQVDLQYELDAREMPPSWSTGYFAQRSLGPNKPPKSFYGTEVFELNRNLRNVAVMFALNASLTDSEPVMQHRGLYLDTPDGMYKAATASPSVIEADVSSSNVYFHGKLLSEAFSNTCKTFTNGAANYGITEQEDSGILAALLRGAAQNKVDFSRIILMRTASNFDQPPARHALVIPLHSGHGGYQLAIENIYQAGIEIVRGILLGWENRFEEGIQADNYIGDVFGTLGGKPDFGPGAQILY